MYMYVLEHYINLFISYIIYIGIDATKSQLCIDIYTLADGRPTKWSAC